MITNNNMIIIFIIFSGWRLSIFWERIQLLMKKSKRNIFTAQTRKLNSTQYVINWLKNHFNQSREIGHLIYFMYFNFLKMYAKLVFSYYTPYGLDNVCPSEVTFPTTVEIYGKTCYIVKPEKQCLTYVKCDDAP